MKVSLPLVVSLLIAALLVGAAGGYYFSPAYQTTMFEANEMGLGVADRFLDLRYLNQMSTHHRGAILLADQIANKTRRPELQKLAADIQKTEPQLIAELMAWKQEWYNDPRPAKDPVVANLGPADETVDLRFLNALIAHHEAGIAMTQEVRTKSSRAEVLDNADTVERFLTNSLEQLKTWRSQWYEV